jgi:hypothetical protein
MKPYWSGPYDGEAVRIGSGGVVPLDLKANALALPLKPRHDIAGALIVPPLGACEVYHWCPDHRRYEWSRTWMPGKVDA